MNLNTQCSLLIYHFYSSDIYTFYPIMVTRRLKIDLNHTYIFCMILYYTHTKSIFFYFYHTSIFHYLHDSRMQNILNQLFIFGNSFSSSSYVQYFRYCIIFYLLYKSIAILHFFVICEQNDIFFSGFCWCNIFQLSQDSNFKKQMSCKMESSTLQQ